MRGDPGRGLPWRGGVNESKATKRAHGRCRTSLLYPVKLSHHLRRVRGEDKCAAEVRQENQLIHIQTSPKNSHRFFNSFFPFTGGDIAVLRVSSVTEITYGSAQARLQLRLFRGPVM